MVVRPEKWQFQTINLFSVVLRNILSCRLGKFVAFHLYSPNIRLQKDKFSRQHFKKTSRTLFKSGTKSRKASHIFCGKRELYAIPYINIFNYERPEGLQQYSPVNIAKFLRTAFGCRTPLLAVSVCFVLFPYVVKAM